MKIVAVYTLTRTPSGHWHSAGTGWNGGLVTHVLRFALKGLR